MKPTLSIVVPAIRVARWQQMYDSIRLPFPWELIICSPYYPPAPLCEMANVKFVRDFGSPMRASCLAANIAEGKYLTWGADDGVFFPATLEKAVNILQGDINGRLVVVTKYLEACSEVHPDWYYHLCIAYPKSPHLPEDWLIFNTAVMHTEYYHTLGGWDCIFEACPLGHADLAARAQRDGCRTILIQDPMLDCTHMPGASGDHGPVYHAHTQNDDPLYRRIYNDPSCVKRTNIDLMNWRRAPMVWGRRFA